MKELFNVLTPLFDLVDTIVVVKLLYVALKKFILSNDTNVVIWNHLSLGHQGSAASCNDCTTEGTQSVPLSV